MGRAVTPLVVQSSILIFHINLFLVPSTISFRLIARYFRINLYETRACQGVVLTLSTVSALINSQEKRITGNERGWSKTFSTYRSIGREGICGTECSHRRCASRFEKQRRHSFSTRYSTSTSASRRRGPRGCAVDETAR